MFIFDRHSYVAYTLTLGGGGEMADTQVSEACAARYEGSTPSLRIKKGPGTFFKKAPDPFFIPADTNF